MASVDIGPVDPSSPYDISDEYFLRDDDVRESIHHLARANDLVVYCGAGVSIDRTGLDWNALVQRLLVKHCEWSPEAAEALGATTEPLHLATIAMDELVKRRGPYAEEALPVLHEWLPRVLYPRDKRLRGANSTSRMFELAAIRALAGKKTTFVTTNFDTSLEEALKVNRKDLADTRIPEPNIVTLKQCESFTEVCRCTYVADQLAKSTSMVDIVYLHGRVPEAGRKARGKIVFSEYDYLLTRSCVEKNLASVLNDRNVLIVGSSLRDAPLLQALMATRNCTRSPEFRRIALQPIAAHSVPGRHLTVAEASVVTSALPKRLDSYDTTLLTPDFFSQVWQFVEEVRLATADPDLYRADAATYPYSDRLETWWSRWEPNLNVEFDISVDQYRRVVDTFETVSAELNRITPTEPPKGREPEAFKLEVWFRNQDKGGGRSLQLWLSSSGVLAARSNPRRARLSVASDYAAVRAYQYGRPTIVEAPGAPLSSSGSRSPSEARWSTFFSVPIEVFVDVAHLPVGVVTLASNMSGRRSKLVAMDRNAKAWYEVEQAMRKLGKELLGIG